MKRAKLLVLGFCFMLGCSRGGFQNSRDYFQSLYGLSPLPLSLTSASFIGRVVDEGGQALPLAKVYLKGSPLYTTTNQKGGFLLSGLQDNHSTVYISSGNGLGKTLDIELGDSSLVENQHIVLEKNARISGRVTSGAAPISDARISMEGSPFSAFSDSEGQFVLELPKGDYRLKVQHLLYNPFEQEHLVLEGDLVRDTTLEPLGFPTVELSLDRAEGSVVRGLSTTILIKKSPSVRYMRVIGHSYNIANQLPSQWVEAQDTLVLNQKGPGLSWLSLQFMDQFGKMTDPLALNYYNTLYDASWRLILGPVTEPLLIRKNEKVAFLGQGPLDNMGASTDQPPKAAETSPSMPNYGYGTVVNAAVEVEGGAVLRGVAQFNRSLRLQGTASHPITWDLHNEAGEEGTAWLRSSQGEFHYAAIQGGSLIFDESYFDETKDGLWQVDHSTFTGMQIAFAKPYVLDTLQIAIRYCDFRLTRLSFYSWASKGEPEPASPATGSSAGSSAGSIPDFISASLDIILDQNNFFGQVQPDYYLHLPDEILNKNLQLRLTVGENYFEFPASIVDNFEVWSPYLGKIRDQPLP